MGNIDVIDVRKNGNKVAFKYNKHSGVITILDNEDMPDGPLALAQINLKPWKGKVSALRFFHNTSKDLAEDAREVLKNYVGKKGWKRRKALSVEMVITRPLNILL